MSNLNKASVEVYWSRLLVIDRFDSSYRKECPFCEDGIFLVGRNRETLELQELDRCISCGQAVRYKDIEVMRKQERAVC